MIVELQVSTDELSQQARHFVDRGVKEVLGEFCSWIPKVRVHVEKSVESARPEYRCLASVSVFGKGLVKSDCTELELCEAINTALEQTRTEIETSVREALNEHPVFESFRSLGNG